MSNAFIVDVAGPRLLLYETQILAHENVAGVLLFSRNFVNQDQLKQLIAEIHSIRTDLFIAVDHEGGWVQRFQRHGFRALPAARVYGETYDIDKHTGLSLTSNFGEIMARELLTVGVDVSLAPVVDIQGNSEIIGNLDRAFHSDPNVVAELAATYIQGMHRAGMPSVAKHFPGHGLIASDSHKDKPVSKANLQQLLSFDLVPFNRLITGDLLDAVMPAHVTYSSVDNEYPAGFSKRWLQDILREKLQFKGIIISDCLGMTGADVGSLQTRAELAFSAGCDLLIACNQDRRVLFNLLDSVTLLRSKESLNRLEVFRRCMVRFSSKHIKNAKSHPQSSSSTKPYDFNKTTSI